MIANEADTSALRLRRLRRRPLEPPSRSMLMIGEAPFMSDFNQIPFGAAEFADNPEPRCPCLLLLDTSGSMQGRPIQQLKEGLVTFEDELAAEPSR